MNRIAATSLKIVCKNLDSVKSYDITNMKVFVLSPWEIFSWVLTFFDQHIGTYRNVHVCLVIIK